MILIHDNKCDFCGTCVGVCPENCIELKEIQLIIDHSLCTQCNKCVWICPVEVFYRQEEK